MSDKEDETKSKGAAAEFPPATVKSAAPPASLGDVDVTADVVTVAPPADASAKAPVIPPPPPPPRGTLPSRPTGGAPTKRTPTLRGEDDMFSIFDVEGHAKVEPKLPPPTGEKPPESKRSPRASQPDQREISRSRKIVDEDLFNLTGSLFNNPNNAPLVAPDVSALALALSKDLGGKPAVGAKPAAPATPSVLDEPAKDAPALFAPLTAPPIGAPSPPKSSTDAIDIDVDVAAAGGKLDKKRLGVGVAIVAACAALAFYLMQRTPSDPGASSGELAAATESNTTPPSGLDTTNGAPLAVTPPRADEPAPAPAATNAEPPSDQAKSAPDTASDKRVASAEAASKGDAKDKPSSNKDKPTEKAPDTKAAAEPPPPSGNKTQDLAAMMAAAQKGGSAPAAPAAPSGGDFSKSAASAALGAAAGRAAGCKKPGDPSGTARVSVTFAPSGRATRASVNGPPFAGTATGGCIAAAFRSASVPPFSGSPVTVSKSVTIR